MSNAASGNSASSAAAEGRVGQAVASMVLGQGTLGGDTFLKRFLVEEVVFDPQELDDDRIKDIQGKYGLIEAAFLNGAEMPTVEEVEMSADHLGMGMRAFHDFGFSLQNYRGGLKMAGA